MEIGKQAPLTISDLDVENESGWCAEAGVE